MKQVNNNWFFYINEYVQYKPTESRWISVNRLINIPNGCYYDEEKWRRAEAYARESGNTCSYH